MADDFDPSLIVIDTAREAFDIKDWNNSYEVAEKLRPLREFTRNFCTVVLIAHNRKAAGEDGDEIAGGIGLTASVDGWLSCYRKEMSRAGEMRLHIRREGRAGLSGEIIVDMSSATHHFTLHQPPADGSDARTERLRALLKAAVDQSPNELTTSSLRNANGLSQRTAHYTIEDLCRLGWLEDSSLRTGPTRRTVIYDLTEIGQSEIGKSEIPWEIPVATHYLPGSGAS